MAENNGNIYMFSGKGGVGKTTCAASTRPCTTPRSEKKRWLFQRRCAVAGAYLEIKDMQKPAKRDRIPFYR
jgi:hypothetical protein